MTTSNETIKLHAIPLGEDFPKAFANGLIRFFKDKRPEDLARSHIIVTNKSARDRIQRHLVQEGERLHPKFHIINDLAHFARDIPYPEPHATIANRFKLLGLVEPLVNSGPGANSRSSLYALADGLANFMDEIRDQKIDPKSIVDLDLGQQTDHWQETKKFLEIIQEILNGGALSPDEIEQHWKRLEAIAQEWKGNPLEETVIVAGSTGSRPSSLKLMEEVAHLKNGHIVLPGYDTCMPAPVWEEIVNDPGMETHPQYRVAKVAQKFGIDPAKIPLWVEAANNDRRAELVSLALRPAPGTSTWLADGPKLSNVAKATERIVWVETESTRQEANVIALRMRAAINENQHAVLVTGDKQLARQVTAALDRWHIVPDNGLGMSMQDTAPGRLMRLACDLLAGPPDPVGLVALLNHPLVHSGFGRERHLKFARKIEGTLRNGNYDVLTRKIFASWANDFKSAEAAAWSKWLVKAVFASRKKGTRRPLAKWIEQHRRLAEALARGSMEDDETNTGNLWEKQDGRAVLKVVENIEAAASAAGKLDADDYRESFSGILDHDYPRKAEGADPRAAIRTSTEAVFPDADVIMLADLNEGNWPARPPSASSPWLNQDMSAQAGLRTPDRSIGLQAHNFEQLFCLNAEVWLIRSKRDDKAETIPSRWINRLEKLLAGLEDRGGSEALDAMKECGERWLAILNASEYRKSVKKAKRPCPIPPVSVRPTSFRVTEIKELIRDPYSFYARRILELEPLSPIQCTPDNLLRGIVFHQIMHRFIDEWTDGDTESGGKLLLALTEKILEEVPETLARARWRTEMAHIADWFISSEIARRDEWDKPPALEVKGKTTFSEGKFTLEGRADRIDQLTDGNLIIYDYKSGELPSAKDQIDFDKQLYLLAIIAEDGGFNAIEGRAVSRAAFLKLGRSQSQAPMPTDRAGIKETREKLIKWLNKYQGERKGYPARRAPGNAKIYSDYDQLSRFGEWDATDKSKKEKVG